MTRRLVPFACALLGALIACSPQGGTSDAGTAETTAAADDATPAARVGDETITVGQLDAWIKDELFRSQTEDDPTKLYELRSQALDNLINRRLLEEEAAQQGVTPDELIASETEKLTQVDDAAVRAFYDQNKDRIQGEFDEVAPQIREHLKRQKRGEAVNAYLAQLRAQKGVDVLLETPRVDVAAEGPVRGPADAPVTVIEFSDYQCPFCRRVEPVVEQLLERYPQQVRLVYRHFPLTSIHPQARLAAEAAVCAEAQGKFWEYHDALFAHEDLAAKALDQYAEQVGLDMDAFHACLEAPETKQRVEADLAAGRAAGVTGTPAFFVNGVPMRGARPLEDFVQVIDRELAEASS